MKPLTALVGLGFLALIFFILPLAFIELNSALGWPRWQTGALAYAGWALILIGAGISLQGLRLFERLGHGTPVPIQPPQRLVTNGLFHYTPHARDSQDQRDWANRAAHFLREVTIVARFQHENIITIYDTGYLYWRFDDPLKDQQGHLDRSGEYLLPFYVTEYLPDGLDSIIISRMFQENRLTRQNTT